MKVQLTCNYCGNIWVTAFFSKQLPEHLNCPTCKDKDIVAKDASQVIDYYQGSPPFPKTEKETEDEAEIDFDYDTYL